MKAWSAVRTAAAVFLLCAWGGVLSCSNGNENGGNNGNNGGDDDKKIGTSQKIENKDGTVTLRMQENGGGFVSTTGEVKMEFAGYTGSGYIDGIADGGNIVYTVSAEEDTTVKIAIHYLCTEVSRVRAALVSVNGNIVNGSRPLAMTTDHKVVKAESKASDYNDTAYLESVSLTKGQNRIIIIGAPAGTHTAMGGKEITIGDGGYLNYVDYLIVTGTGIDFGTDTTPYYTFSYASENETAGAVISGMTQSSAVLGTEITVTAQENEGWKFERWSDGATENPHSFELTKNTAIFAHFIPKDYTLPSGLVGYATITDDAGVKYTISGGAGAKEENKITIASYDELTKNKALLASDEPKIITISGIISTEGNENPLLSEKYTVGSNTTIYGSTSKQGRLRNIEFSVEGENVIIRNMMFGEVISWDKPVKSGADDALSLNGATHVWVDHCEFQSHLTPQDLDGNEITSDHPYYSSDDKWAKDFYDGLLDIKNGSSWITISNCYFHDHWKACLCASGDGKADKNPTTGATDKDMRVTFYGNYWKDINSRQPLFRWGKAHIYNSYFNASGSDATGINCRAGSELYIENNVFEGLKTAIGFFFDVDSARTGTWTSTGNNGASNTSTTSYKPPYTWKPTSAEVAKANVVNEAGVGKLSAADLQ